MPKFSPAKLLYCMIIKYVVDDFGSPFITNWGQINFIIALRVSLIACIVIPQDVYSLVVSDVKFQCLILKV